MLKLIRNNYEQEQGYTLFGIQSKIFIKALIKHWNFQQILGKFEL